MLRRGAGVPGGFEASKGGSFLFFFTSRDMYMYVTFSGVGIVKLETADAGVEAAGVGSSRHEKDLFA